MYESVSHRRVDDRVPGDPLGEILDDVRAFVWEADPAGRRFAFVSEQAEALLGYPLPRWLTEPDFRVRHTHPDDRDQVTSWFAQRVRDGRDAQIEYRMLAADGRTVWVRDVVHVLPGGPGVGPRLHGVVMDITDVRTAQEDRERLQSQVAIAQRMDSLGRMAGGMAHDFNNLLTVVLGNLDLALATASGATREAIGRAGEAGRTASDLARQLLAIARATASPREPIVLAPLVSGVVGMLQRTFASGVHLRYDVPPALRVEANAGQLRQVLLNLALNARDAMPRGGILEVRARHVPHPDGGLELRPRPDGYIEIAVSDTGTGMSADVAGRMFDPFFTTKGEQGTGLGAAVVYGIVREHEGNVVVDSIPGRGTSVRVYLPAAEVPAGAAATIAARPPDGGSTVLVVDDVDAVRAVTRSVLEAEGYRTIGVASGDEALHIMRSDTEIIDLIVLDCIMPRVTGRAVYDALRAEGRRTGIVFVSGYAPDTLRGLPAGPDWAFVAKPFERVDLSEAVAAVLAASRPLGSDGVGPARPR